MERKRVPCIATKIDADHGIVASIVAVFGNVDLAGDIIQPGSFAKTISERLGKIRVLDQHRTDSVLSVLGKPLSLREVGRGELPATLLHEYPDATGGLLAETQFFLETPEGQGAFTRLKLGGLNEWSIGFDPVDTDFSEVQREGRKYVVRNLRQCRLWEYSPVVFAANQATTTVSAKESAPMSAATVDHKSVVPYQDLPLAARDRDWDADAAVGRVRTWAGGPDKADVDWPKYRRAFVWYDSAAAEEYGSYKLPIADILDGALTAIPRGVFACAGALQGARGGVDIPAADVPAAKAHVAKYYGNLDMSPPWESGEKDTTPPALRAGRVLSGSNAAAIAEAMAAMDAAMAKLNEVMRRAGMMAGDDDTEDTEHTDAGSAAGHSDHDKAGPRAAALTTMQGAPAAPPHGAGPGTTHASRAAAAPPTSDGRDVCTAATLLDLEQELTATELALLEVDHERSHAPAAADGTG